MLLPRMVDETVEDDKGLECACQQFCYIKVGSLNTRWIESMWTGTDTMQHFWPEGRLIFAQSAGELNLFNDGLIMV